MIEAAFMRTRGAGHALLTCPFLQLVQGSQALCSALRQVDLDAPSVPEGLSSSVLSAEFIAEGLERSRPT